MQTKNVKSAGAIASMNRHHPPPYDPMLQLNLSSLHDDINRPYRLTKSQGQLLKTNKKQPQQTVNMQIYKNMNYCDSESSYGIADKLSYLNSETYSTQINTEQKNYVKIGQRPITCPNTACKKMVAIESILLHFYFDHPKVPRQFADVNNQSSIPLKLSLLSTQSKCLSVIFPPTSKQSISTSPVDQKKIESYALLTGTYKDKSTLMLMGAIVSHKVLEQVEIQEMRDNAKPKMKIKQEDSQTVEKNSKCENDIAKDKLLSPPNLVNEYLLIWICKLNDKTKYYEVRLQRYDKKGAHSYVGEAIHLRENNDVKSIYDRAECLMINGIAVKKLFDKQEEIQLTINILDL